MTHRAAWLTDIHLNFVSRERVVEFGERVRRLDVASVLIGGDIGEAPDFAASLEQLAAQIGRPIYFVLGNHDYYRGSIAGVRDAARRLSRAGCGLTWLPDVEFVELTENTSLVGHCGWGDGRAADFLASEIILNDYLLIEELRECLCAEEGGSPAAGLEDEALQRKLLARLNALGDEAAAHFARVVPLAAGHGREIVVLTHVPPFREACWHEGELSDDNWAPHFTCVAVGEMLRDFMQRHPDHRMTVLCGHTHGAGRAQILDNLVVHTGGAEYRSPCVQQVFDWE